MKNCGEIKRVLGVGTATMADHLRQYKDPFEPSDRELTLERRGPVWCLEIDTKIESSELAPYVERRRPPREGG